MNCWYCDDDAVGSFALDERAWALCDRHSLVFSIWALLDGRRLASSSAEPTEGPNDLPLPKSKETTSIIGTNAGCNALDEFEDAVARWWRELDHWKDEHPHFVLDDSGAIVSVADGHVAAPDENPPKKPRPGDAVKTLQLISLYDEVIEADRRLFEKAAARVIRAAKRHGCKTASELLAALTDRSSAPSTRDGG